MAVIIFFLLFSSIFLNTEAIDKNCPPAKCFPNGPEILFPFSIKGLQPQNCSYPGFKLLCKENKTTIHFPSYGDLVVKSISYDSKRLMSLLDPENCVHQVFLNLDLSQTPFRYYFVLKNYTYLNCSAALPRPFVQVPCMSGSKYHVYVVASFGVVPDSCKPVKTVAIPFSYSPCLADDSFGRDLARRFRHMFQCSTRKGPEYPRIHFHGCNPCQCQDLLLQKRLVREVMQALCYPQTCKILPEGGKKSG